MAIYGYGRVSREEQTSENQKLLIEAQSGMKLDAWYEDHATSGSIKAADRPMFAKLMKDATSGDTIVFSRVDRVSRRTSDVLNTVEGLLERGIEVYILQIGKESLNSAMGKVILGVFAIFAENERLSIVERTKSGLKRTKAQGTVLGPPLVIKPDVLQRMCEDRAAGSTLDTLSKKYGAHRNTIHKVIKDWGSNLEGYADEYTKRQAQYRQARYQKSRTLSA